MLLLLRRLLGLRKLWLRARRGALCWPEGWLRDGCRMIVFLLVSAGVGRPLFGLSAFGVNRRLIGSSFGKRERRVARVRRPALRVSRWRLRLLRRVMRFASRDTGTWSGSRVQRDRVFRPSIALQNRRGCVRCRIGLRLGTGAISYFARRFLPKVRGYS